MLLQKVNLAITKATDLILLPFQMLPPVWGIIWLSLISSFVILVIFKYLSSPKKIRREKDRIKAYILAIRIYRDQWLVILESFVMSLWHTLRYFALNLVPLAVVLVPLFFLFVQMDIRYGYRAFKEGETAIVKVKLQEGFSPEELSLKKSQEGKYKKLITVNIYALGEKNWKVKFISSGNLKFKTSGEEITKNFTVEERVTALSLRKYCRAGLHLLLYPAEPLCNNSDIEYIEIKYPSRSISFLGIKTHWLVWYLLFVLIIVLALHKRFKIEF